MKDKGKGSRRSYLTFKMCSNQIYGRWMIYTGDITFAPERIVIMLLLNTYSININQVKSLGVLFEFSILLASFLFFFYKMFREKC